MKKEFPPERSQVAWTILVLLVCCDFVSPGRASGQPPSTSVMAGESLVHRRVTLHVDDQTIGELLPQLLPADRGQGRSDRRQGASIQSLWFDRQLDTNACVSLTEASTPVGKILLNVAEMNDLAVFPLPGVLVMGRPEWVDSTVSHLPRLDGAADDLISIRWPSGSTAAEVLALMLAAPAQRDGGRTISDLSSILDDDENVSSTLPSWVPHDIWASGNLMEVNRTLAVGLFLGRFRCALRPGTRLETLAGDRHAGLPTERGKRGLGTLSEAPAGVVGWSEMPPSPPFQLAYPAGDSAVALRAAFANTLPRPSIGVSNHQLLIKTSAPNHRHAITIHWQAAGATPQRAAGDADASTGVFDLQLIDKPAAEVLQQLAQAAGKTFRIETGAERAGEVLVTLDVKKKTLEQLARLVAEATDLNVQWGETEVVLGAR